MGICVLIIFRCKYNYLITNLLTLKLKHKLSQTNSGLRFDGGTQGSALDLILEQPIKGYGYGNQLYHNVYNQQVKQHKNWYLKIHWSP